MRALICGVALLLCGCGDLPAARTKAEIQSIAHDEAIEATGDLNDRVEQLDKKVEEQSNTINELESDKEGLAERIETLEARDKEVRDRLNM